MLSEVEILEGARALVERGWVQGSYAVDEWGRRVDELSIGAVAFCVLGAIRRSGGMSHVPLENYDGAVKLVMRRAREEGMESFVAWHDAEGRSVEEVVGFLGRVIGGVA